MHSFGRLADGTEIHAVTLGSPLGLQAEILTLGGTLRNLTLPVNGERLALALSLDDLAAYLNDRMYIGQLVGRYANRISNARFELDGCVHELTANEGSNALHGGEIGFGKHVWTIREVAEGADGCIKLGHHSPAGANGFPGNLDVSALIAVHGNTLSLHFEATTDAPTPISFTWHPYFNLSGDPQRPIGEHCLRLAARRYLPVKPSWLPTGEIAPVEGTRFDFRKSTRLQDPQPAQPAVLNHYWVLDRDVDIAGEVYSPKSGVRMEIRTNLPGLQVYDGFALREQYSSWHAVSIEPGNFPDAPNHANFPSCILRPGETHRSFVSFSFSA